MSSLLKLTGEKLSKEKTDQLVEKFLKYIRNVGVNPREVILFGSGSKYLMTTFSDLDFVFVFGSPEELQAGRKAYYSGNHKSDVPVDVIFTTQEEFERKAKIGGVFFICRTEGKSVFRRLSNG